MPRSVSWILSWVLVGMAGVAVAADCNGNGVEDSLELTGSFRTAQAVSLPGRYPAELVVDDYNADGHRDFALITYVPVAVVVMLADGEEGYFPGPTVPLEGHPMRLRGGDVDNDGLPDLVLHLENAPRLLTLRNTGDAEFTPAELLLPEALSNTQAIELVDIDGDGDLDAAISSDRLTGGAIDVLINEDGLTFGQLLPVWTGDARSVSALHGADLDGNGAVDLAFAREGRLFVLLNNGDRTFAAPVERLVQASVEALRSADMNGDGHLDLLASGSSIGVLLGAGGGSLQESLLQADVPVEVGPAVPGDIDGDGDIDVASPVGRSLLCLWNDGTGRLGGAASFVVGDGPSSAAVEDLDSDGDLDVATLNYDSSDLSILRNEGGGSFATNTNLLLGGDLRQLASGDLDADGRTDLVVGSRTTSARSPGYHVLWGEPGARFAIQDLDLRTSIPEELLVADLDRDGALDIVTPNRVWRNAGGRAFERINFDFVPGDLRETSFSLPDLDGDQAADLVGLSDTAVVLAGNQGGQLSFLSSIPLPAQPLCVAAADIDLDGRMDLLVGLVDAFLSFQGLEAGGFADPEAFELSSVPGAIRVADLDADGLPDVLVETDSSAVLLWNLGAGALAPPEGIIAPGGLRGTAFLDHDADGKVDIALLGPSGVHVLLAGESRLFTPGPSVKAGLSPFAILAVDIDGASPPELAVANGSGDITLIFSGRPTASDCDDDGILDACEGAEQDCDADGILDGCEVSRREVAFSAGPYGVASSPLSLAVADLDGDGNADAAIVSNTGQQTVRALASDGAGRFQTRWGRLIPYCKDVAAADFNGDGLPDLAVAAADETGTGMPVVEDGLFLFTSLGGWSFADAVRYPAGIRPFRVKAADLDRDGNQDLIVTNIPEPFPLPGADQDLTILRNEAGTFQPWRKLHIPVQSLAVVDVEGDGFEDLLILQGAQLVPLRNDGEGDFTAAEPVDLGGVYTRLLAMDTDGDADDDVVLGGREGRGVILLRNEGGALQPPAQIAASREMEVQSIAALDVDRDGDLDLALGSLIGCCPEVTALGFLISSSTGEFSPGPLLPMPLGRALLAADLNHEGGLDLIATGSNSAAIHALLNRSPRFLDPDCNGNGRPDECDADSDADTVPDECDLCPGGDDFLDEDGDGSPDCLGVHLRDLVAAGSVLPFVRGDVNDSGRVDISDAVAALGFLFLGSSLACPRPADVDADGKINITDPIGLLNYLFLGGSPVAPPHPRCGISLERDGLTCAAFLSCD